MQTCEFSEHSAILVYSARSLRKAEKPAMDRKRKPKSLIFLVIWDIWYFMVLLLTNEIFNGSNNNWSGLDNHLIMEEALLIFKYTISC